MNLTISIGAVFTVLLSALLVHRLNIARERNRQYRDDLISFKKSFVPFFKQLEDIHTTPATAVLQNFPEQDELARKFIIGIPSARKREKFKKLWLEYEYLYQQKKLLGIAAVIATEVDDLEQANLSNPNSVNYIYEQTRIRLNEIRGLVERALSVL